MFKRHKRAGAIEIGPDDIIVVQTDRPVSGEQAAQIKEIFKKSGIDAVVSDPSLTVVAIKRRPPHSQTVVNGPMERRA